jgi:hypothetical protein
VQYQEKRGAARRVLKTFKIWGLFLTEELAHNFFFFYKEMHSLCYVLVVEMQCKRV